MEELSELSCAWSHYLDMKITEDELLEEIADVHLQIMKLVKFLGKFEMKKELEIENIIMEKLGKKVRDMLE